jgi:subtilisin family serine protease/subtilisin-like proprotein convertase family protein
MTNEMNPSQATNAGDAMPEASIGKTLQRGGEELELEKVTDRFTVSSLNPTAVGELVEQLPAEVNKKLPNTELTEVVVNPTRKEAVMNQLRAADAIKFASHVYRLKDSPGTRIYLTDQVTVQFAPEVEAGAIAQITQAMGLRQLKPVVGIPNTFVFEVTSEATENPVKIANRLMQLREVLTAEPNVVVRSQELYRPREPFYPQQWHLNHSTGTDLAANSHVFAEKAWDITRGHRSIVVAIADDSVDLNHPDFQGIGKIVAPRDFADLDFLPDPERPDDNHGTACAGVAVAEENGVGTVGAAPGCALMPLRTSGYLDDESIEDLFNWAREKGAAVISCSWGASSVYFPLSLRQRAVLTRAATEGRNGKGCVIVFASGNANRPVNSKVNERGWVNNILSGSTAWLGGFAAHPDVIAVAACTSLNKKAAYSNWGAEISVCAPSNNAHPGVGLQEVGYVYTGPEITKPIRGLGIVTSDRVGQPGYDPSDITTDFGGTSSACPLVAGVAALVLSVNPDLTATDVKQILQQTADKIIDPDPDPQLGFKKGTYEAGGRCDWFGFGKVNAFKAVQAARQRQVRAIAPSRQIQQENTDVIAIPDADLEGVVSNISISETNLLRDIQVKVDISHSFMSDLEVSLIAPTGETVLLQGRILGRKVNLQTTYTLQTTPLLRRLLGKSVQGNWQLMLVDFAVGDTGTLNHWQLNLGI